MGCSHHRRQQQQQQLRQLQRPRVQAGRRACAVVCDGGVPGAPEVVCDGGNLGPLRWVDPGAGQHAGPWRWTLMLGQGRGVLALQPDAGP